MDGACRRRASYGLRIAFGVFRVEARRVRACAGGRPLITQPLRKVALQLGRRQPLNKHSFSGLAIDKIEAYNEKEERRVVI